VRAPLSSVLTDAGRGTRRQPRNISHATAPARPAPPLPSLRRWTAYYFPAPDPAVDSKLGLWSSAHGLFFRDNTYYNKSSPNGQPIFWARGNAWAIAAMARSVEALPPGHPYAAEFAGKLVSMANALAPLQGADGLWRASLLDPAAFPNPETTGSAGITYALAWAVRHGWIPSDRFLPIVLNAWTGLSTVALQPGGLVGWCQPPNGQPAPATQTDTSDFCVGLWLMAASEVFRLVSAL
jgi:unsaturated rhamnogalacturonyl hydrolase